MRKQSFKEPIEPNHWGEYAIYSEILAADVKERRIEVLYFENLMDHEERSFDDLGCCQLLLNVEEVIHELTDISDCIC